MVNKLLEAYEIYDKYLNNKRVELLFENGQEIKCDFKKQNFLHLTGVKPKINITAKNFYKKCAKNEIKNHHIIVDGNAKMKLDVFCNLKLKEGDQVLLHGLDNNINILFHTEHKISKNSAILCIKENAPQSLLKKNRPIAGTKHKGYVKQIIELK